MNHNDVQFGEDLGCSLNNIGVTEGERVERTRVDSD
jgi:hypothetical protein